MDEVHDQAPQKYQNKEGASLQDHNMPEKGRVGLFI